MGTVNRVNANPPDVFRMAIYKLAVRMMLVHNHPSGSITPSKQDQDLTDHMLKVGKLINIEVIDHLVISEEKYTSFEDDGIMAQLKKSGLFEIVDREKNEIKELKLRIEKERAVKESKIEIAKSLRESGMSEADIKKHTGLNLHTIRSL